jgi:hypothetical protein
LRSGEVSRRLYEIDAIINKALVSGGLSGILSAIDAGLLIGLESLVGSITRPSSATPLVPVISTLAIDVLFWPLRNRMQRISDRRFYRRRYDAARLLQAFSATLRQEVDLATLSDHLRAVVEETMQPTSVSLRLRPPTHEQVPSESR